MKPIIKADIVGADETGIDPVGRSTQVPEDNWDYDS